MLVWASWNEGGEGNLGHNETSPGGCKVDDGERVHVRGR